MQILSIGNSFSQDAQRYLHEIAKADNENIFCANLYIGGCSLERHMQNILANASEYDYQINGCENGKKTTIKNALQDKEWDIITVQQVSSDSGIKESYYPFITQLLDYIKKYKPNAEIILHQTWAYETGSDHRAFPKYNCDRFIMHKKIVETNNEIASECGINRIIRSGELISRLRETKMFNYDQGGSSLCRDGFHMHFCYGRYAIGLLWYKMLTGKSVINNSFNPPIEENDPLYIKKISIIIQNVEDFLD